jgi:ABC-type oligopeptide transport system ATPase subunit
MQMRAPVIGFIAHILLSQSELTRHCRPDTQRAGHTPPSTIAVMYRGDIVEIGPRRAVFDDPRHAYTLKLMAAAPVPDPTQRRARRGLAVEEIASPFQPIGYDPPPARYAEIAPGHYVRQDA